MERRRTAAAEKRKERVCVRLIDRRGRVGEKGRREKRQKHRY